MKSRIVALDSQIIAWGLRSKFEKNFEAPDHNKVWRAAKLIEHESAQGASLVISSITLSELLCVELHNKRGFIDSLTRVVRVLDFNSIAAFKFAEIEEKAKVKGAVWLRQSEVGRPLMRNDLLIIATCVANNVDLIYSNDKGLRQFCEGFIKASDLPEFAEQSTIEGVDGPKRVEIIQRSERHSSEIQPPK